MKRERLYKLGNSLQAILNTRAETSEALLLVGSTLVSVMIAAANEICESIDLLKEKPVFVVTMPEGYGAAQRKEWEIALSAVESARFILLPYGSAAVAP